MRKFAVVFVLVTALFSSSHTFAFDIWIETAIEGDEKPIVTGRTNFPSGTELTVTIWRETTEYSEMYEAQDNVKVNGGEFKSSAFSKGRMPLSPGTYALEISSSLAVYQSFPVNTTIGMGGKIGDQRVIYHKKTFGLGVTSKDYDTPVSRPIYWLRAKIDGWNRPTITGLTNLPKDTELTVTLWQLGHETQDNIKIVDLNKDGYDFKSSAFSHKPLKPGKYYLEISQPIEKFRSLNANVVEDVEIRGDRVVYYKAQFNVEAWTRVSKSPWGEFRGVPFGAPVELAKDEIPGLDCSGADDRWTCVSRNIEIGEAVIDYCSMEFIRNKMVSIYMTFKSDDYGYLKDVYSRKYGKPSSSKNYVVQTGFGVKHNNQSLKWWDGKVSLELDRFTNTINEGSIYYITHDEINRIEKEKSKKKKKAVKDL